MGAGTPRLGDLTVLNGEIQHLTPRIESEDGDCAAKVKSVVTLLSNRALEHKNAPKVDAADTDGKSARVAPLACLVRLRQC